MKMYLEHANITVADVERSMQFFKTAFPHFSIRGEGTTVRLGKVQRWVHFGTDDYYIALENAILPSPDNHKTYIQPGINHLGFVVDDVEGVIDRLTRAGYRRGIEVVPHPHRKRAYFFDDDGNEYEFVQYFSDKPQERNDYVH